MEKGNSSQNTSTSSATSSHKAMKSEPKAEALYLTLHERYRIDPSYEIDPKTIGDADRATLERYLHEVSQGAKDAYDPNAEDDDREFK